jgi:hypothetical protein
LFNHTSPGYVYRPVVPAYGNKSGGWIGTKETDQPDQGYTLARLTTSICAAAAIPPPILYSCWYLTATCELLLLLDLAVVGFAGVVRHSSLLPLVLYYCCCAVQISALQASLDTLLEERRALHEATESAAKVHAVAAAKQMSAAASVQVYAHVCR